MTESNSRNEAPEVKKNGKVLDNFLNFLNTRKDQDSYAGFCLKMEDEVFGFENYNNVVTCLGKCAQHLVEMRLDVPETGVPFAGPLPDSLKLPQLQKFVLSTVEGQLLQNSTVSSIIWFTQSLVQQSKTLKHLHFQPELIPPEFQNVRLPPSLVTLKLKNGENPRILECLTRNQLPELKELTLEYCMDSVFPEEDLLFQVFDNLRHSLRVLSINDSVDLVGEFKLRFPVMENLERLRLYGSQIQLKMATDSFPKLTHVELEDVAEDLLMKQFSCPIPSVTTLKIENERRDDDDFSLDLMKAVHRAFPNLTDLSLEEHEMEEVAIFQYMFREMRQLKQLSIGTWPKRETSSDHWDSLLMGAPVEFVQGLKACPLEFWKNLKMDIQTQNSIKMLKDLTYLKLNSYGHDGNDLISDLAFIYALNGMTKLEHVKLGRRFSASKEIVEEWEKQGRKIEFQR